MDNLLLNGNIIGKTMDVKSVDKYITSGGLLSFVGSYSTNGTGTTSNISIPLDSLSLQQNDIVILSFAVGGGSDLSYRISNFTQICDLFQSDTYSSNLQVGYKIMGETPDNSVTITGGTASTLSYYAVAVHVWRNCDTSTPLDVTPVTNSQANTACPNPSAITPITENSIIIVVGSAGHNDRIVKRTFSNTNLDNFITNGSSNLTLGSHASIGIGSKEWTSGSFDPQLWSWSATNSANYSANSVTFALRSNIVYGNYKNSGIWSLDAFYDRQFY